MSMPLALIDVTVITGDQEGTTRPGTTVLVGPGGTIDRVGRTEEVEVPTGYRRIDSAGRFLMPGLINAHAHLFSDGKPLPPVLMNEKAEKAVTVFFRSPLGKRYLKWRTKTAVLTQLKTGVTTIRSLGDVRYEAVTIANEIEAGDYPGPRLLASGPLLAVSGGHGAPQIALVSDNPWDARRNVRINLRGGVTAIKISATGGVTDAKTIGEAGRPQMTEEEMRAICEEAHNAGVLVAAHAQSKEGILASLRAGVDTIEHGATLTDEIVELFHHNPRSLHGSSAFIPTFQACLPLVKTAPEVTGINAVNKANAEIVLEEMLAGLAAAVENDVTIGMGTDSALTFVTHYNTWREIDYLIRYGGLSPARALHAATQANAGLLGLRAETGAVEAGLSADLLLTDTNPLEDIRTLASPRAVIARGQLVEDLVVERFDEIDAVLDSI
ncbi:metal-dependent hydrolase family protein [Ruania zhangjianzhongii]|uniref:metal-dependent hydrolase family protein n=1 Tax=Ruania zhangjianzhongii TaxID=2603206 RepID=UPI0011CBF701|nr:amidohydrolase family protein [Ruania zhangjianzhongii]